MASALDISRQILQLAAAEDEAEPITQLRLHKLLYYVQGWSLALRGHPLFDGDFQAWAHGPVLRDLYPTFADYGANPISSEDWGAPESLEQDEAEFVESVWEAYKGYSPAALRRMTHSEPPWQKAHAGYGPADRCEEVITIDSMREHFVEAAREQ